MEYDDRVSIATPEGLDLDVQLAGLGSRFVAQLIDSALKGAIIAALVGGLAALGSSGDDSEEGSLLLGAAILIVIVFLITFAYDVLFETLGQGRTPGKRLSGLRVVEAGGQPIGLRASATRNLLRLVDGEALLYIPGMVSILVTSRNQRLGDLAAATLVVRERSGGRDGGTPPAADPEVGAAAPGADGWDVSAITREDLVLIRRFLERRTGLASGPRERLARRIAERVGPKVAGAPTDLAPEALLEQVARAKASR